MGRSPKEIKWDVVEKRMQAGETALSIASRHYIDTDTFYRRFKKEYGCSFGDYKDKFREVGKSDILFTQYMKAMAGNPKMLELLGKEWCGQGKNEVTKSPFEDVNSLLHENMILKAQIDKLKEEKDGNQSETK